MGISLSIISGKGGCGKTTLALSISQMLASANLKVLLIDCDMSTHGATYFFENLLKEKENILTVSDLFSESAKLEIKRKKAISARKNIDFIPSSVVLTQNTPNYFKFDANIEVLELLNNNYDVILYDCQAGYSELTKAVTRVTTKNLVVMEVDAVTSSSTRVLTAQLEHQLDSADTYQVFNKITEEDFEIYKLVTHGTMFTNLTPIRYDLSIKKAFAINELPVIDIKNTAFSNNIFDLTYALFDEYRNKLNKVVVKFKKDMRDDIKTELKHLHSRKRAEKVEKLRKNIFEFGFIIIFVAITIMTLYAVIEEPYYFSDYKMIVLLLFVVMTFGLVLGRSLNLFGRILSSEESDTDKKIAKLENELSEVNDYISSRESYATDYLMFDDIYPNEIY